MSDEFSATMMLTACNEEETELETATVEEHPGDAQHRDDLSRYLEEEKPAEPLLKHLERSPTFYEKCCMLSDEKMETPPLQWLAPYLPVYNDGTFPLAQLTLDYLQPASPLIHETFFAEYFKFDDGYPPVDVDDDGNDVDDDGNDVRGRTYSFAAEGWCTLTFVQGYCMRMDWTRQPLQLEGDEGKEPRHYYDDEGGDAWDPPTPPEENVTFYFDEVQSLLVWRLYRDGVHVDHGGPYRILFSPSYVNAKYSEIEQCRLQCIINTRCNQTFDWAEIAPRARMYQTCNPHLRISNDASDVSPRLFDFDYLQHFARQYPNNANHRCFHTLIFQHVLDGLLQSLQLIRTCENNVPYVHISYHNKIFCGIMQHSLGTLPLQELVKALRQMFTTNQELRKFAGVRLLAEIDKLPL